MADTIPPRRNIFHSPLSPFLWTLLFLAIFLGIFYSQKPSNLLIENYTVKEIFSKYGVYSGPALAVLWMLAMYILAGLKRLIGLRRFRALDPIVVLLVMVPSAAFGWQLLYREKPYTDIARGIIGSLAAPLLFASLAVSTLALLWFFFCLLRRS